MEKLQEDFDNCLYGSGLRLALIPFDCLVPKFKWLKSRDTVRAFADKYAEQALRSVSLEKGQERARISFPRHLAETTPSRVEVIDQLLNLSIANMATTAIHLSNCVFILARNPDIWWRLQDEVTSLGDKELDFDNLRSLEIMRNPLNESIRLYPVFPHLSRVALEDTLLPVGGGP